MQIHDFEHTLKIKISIFLKNVSIKSYNFTFVYYAIIYIEAIYMIQYGNNNPNNPIFRFYFFIFSNRKNAKISIFGSNAIFVYINY